MSEVTNTPPQITTTTTTTHLIISSSSTTTGLANTGTTPPPEDQYNGNHQPIQTRRNLPIAPFAGGGALIGALLLGIVLGFLFGAAAICGGAFFGGLLGLFGGLTVHEHASRSVHGRISDGHSSESGSAAPAEGHTHTPVVPPVPVTPPPVAEDEEDISDANTPPAQPVEPPVPLFQTPIRRPGS